MGYRISVIDVNDAFLTTIQSLLDEQGYEVDVVQGSPTVHEQVAAFKPHVIVLDLRLGTTDGGLQVLDRLRAEPTLAATPVIVCSADVAGLYEREDAFLHQGVHALEKPFGLEELLDLLEAMVPHD
jgi:CheY-like chemotaxis protein